MNTLLIIILSILVVIVLIFLFNKFSGYKFRVSAILDEEIVMPVEDSPLYILSKAQVFFVHKHPSQWTTSDVLKFSLWLSNNKIINPVENDFLKWKEESNFRFKD